LTAQSLQKKLSSNSRKKILQKESISSYVQEIKNKESYLNAIFEKLEINDTDLIDKAIIFLGIIELEQEKFPKEVTFDECIRLARKFSNPESYKFINACLDKFSKLN
jgi:transcription termination factor NusB